MAPGRKRGNPDAIDLLAADHRLIRKLFRRFAVAADDGARRAIVEQACAELKLHATLEAEIFYPAARAALAPDDASAVSEAEVEHGGASALVAELERLEPADPYYAATFTVLARHAGRHFTEEEKGLFVRLRGSSIDLAALAGELGHRRQALVAAAHAPGQPEPSGEAEGKYEPELDEEVARLLAR